MASLPSSPSPTGPHASNTRQRTPGVRFEDVNNDDDGAANQEHRRRARIQELEKKKKKEMASREAQRRADARAREVVNDAIRPRNKSRSNPRSAPPVQGRRRRAPRADVMDSLINNGPTESDPPSPETPFRPIRRIASFDDTIPMNIEGGAPPSVINIY